MADDASRTAPDGRGARRRAYKAVSSGTFLISTGFVLLLNTLGTLGWGVWLELALLWPILLIAAGVRMLFVETRLHLLCLAGPLLVAGSTAYVVARYQEGGTILADSGGDLGQVEIRCPGRPDRERAYLDIRFAAGELILASHEGTSQATAVASAARAGTAEFRGRVRYRGREPRVSCSGAGDVGLRWGWPDRGVRIVFPFSRSRSFWEVDLGVDLPVGLDVNLAAAYARMDLTSFDLASISLDGAASRVELRLGEPRRRVPVRVDGAVMDLKLIVPEGACFTLWRERTFNVLDVEDDLRGRSGDGRVVARACEKLRTAAPRYEISCEMPIAHVSIETAGRPL